MMHEFNNQYTPFGLSVEVGSLVHSLGASKAPQGAYH